MSSDGTQPSHQGIKQVDKDGMMAMALVHNAGRWELTPAMPDKTTASHQHRSISIRSASQSKAGQVLEAVLRPLAFALLPKRRDSLYMEQARRCDGAI